MNNQNEKTASGVIGIMKPFSPNYEIAQTGIYLKRTGEEDKFKQERAIVTNHHGKILYQKEGAAYGSHKYSGLEGKIDQTDLNPEFALRREFAEEVTDFLQPEVIGYFDSQQLNIKKIFTGQRKTNFSSSDRSMPSPPQLEITQYKNEKLRGIFNQFYMAYIIFNEQQSKIIENEINKPNSNWIYLTTEEQESAIAESADQLRPITAAILYYLETLKNYQNI